MDVASLAQLLEADTGNEIAALMVTNPSTLGIFEEDIAKVAQKCCMPRARCCIWTART